MCSSSTLKGTLNPNPIKHTAAWIDIGNKSHGMAMDATKRIRGSDDRNGVAKKPTAFAAKQIAWRRRYGMRGAALEA